MASVYTNDLRLEEIGSGEQSGSWGDTTNTNLELIAEAFAFGTEAIPTNVNNSTHTTTIADGASDPGRAMFLKYTGSQNANVTVTIGPNTVSKLWFIENATTGSSVSLIIKQGSGAAITIPHGDTKAIYSNGAGTGAAMVDAFASLSVVDLNVSGNLDVDGTANLDVVDIDGAVNMATTALVTGILTTTAATVFNGGFASNGDSTITIDDNGTALNLVSTDQDAAVGPNLDLFRNPGQAGADGDLIGQLNFYGLNDASEKTHYLYLNAKMNDVADGSEDVRWALNGIVAGADVSFIEFTAGTTATGADPELVFNNASKDINFRVESDGNANALFVDGGANLVGIGTATPIALTSNVAPGLTIKSNGPFIVLQDANNANSCNYIANNSGVLQFGLNADDGGSKVEIAQFGTFGAVFNEGSADLDFRVESDDKPFCLFVNSTLDNVSIGYSAESQQASKGLVVLSGDETGGVYIVKEDGSQPSSGEGLGSLGWRGIDDTNHMGAADAKISAFATENHDGSNAATDMRFFIKTTSEGPGNGATETMRLLSNKDVKILDGNLVIGTDGHGIDFTVAGTANNVAGRQSNLLDDYEEGSFTPVLSGARPGGGSVTFAVQLGRYTKVGNIVQYDIVLQANGSTIDANNSNNFEIHGLPYTVINIGSQNFPIGSLFPDGGFNQSAATQGYKAVLQNNTQVIKIFGIVSAAGSNVNVLLYNQLGRTNSASSLSLRITGTYRVAT